MLGSSRNIFCLPLLPLLAVVFLFFVPGKCTNSSIRRQLYPSDIFNPPRYMDMYYTDVEKKLAESTSLGKCKVQLYTQRNPKKRKQSIATLSATEVNPTIFPKSPKDMVHLFSGSLCKLQEMQSYLRRKQANSCTKELKLGMKKGAKIRAGHLHPSHSRCKAANALALQNLCDHHRMKNNFAPYIVIPPSTLSRQTYVKPPFTIEATDAILSKSGMLLQHCGLIGLLASCGAVRYRYVP